MNNRAGLLALVFVGGFACTVATAQEPVRSPLQYPFPWVGPDIRPGAPLDSIRNRARSRRPLSDHFVPGDRHPRGPRAARDWFFRDEDSSRYAAGDNGGVVLPDESWLPPTSGPRPNPKREVVRVLRDALRDAIAQSTELDETILAMSPFQSENRGTPDSSSSGSLEDRVRFRFGVSHHAPRVEMRCDLGGSALGLSVNAVGKVRFELALARAGSGRLEAGLDPVNEHYEVGYRLKF